MSHASSPYLVLSFVHNASAATVILGLNAGVVLCCRMDLTQLHVGSVAVMCTDAQPPITLD